MFMNRNTIFEVNWKNGRSDFVFNGVMGIQRIAKASKFSRGYTAFMKKKE